MKAILKFKLPDDKCDFEIASKAMSWALVAFDMDNYLREQLKYHGAGEETENARTELREILDSYNITLDMIE